MKTDKVNASIVAFQCPNSIRKELAELRVAVANGHRIPSEGDMIRTVLATGIAVHKARETADA